MSGAGTIFALASGAGRAGVAVLRVSGPASGSVLDALAGGRPAPRHAALRRLRSVDGDVLDRALVVFMPGPRSYTGEDCAELHVHGGRAVIEGVAAALAALGARPAEPGEFTRRAFLNGRLDLVEAEAVADLVAADTAAQRRQALRQMEGALGALYHGWAGRLCLLLARQEALIDFSEEDLPEATEPALLAELVALEAEIGTHLADGRRGERLREGLIFVVSGPPNVGKSSLVNALAAREVAIVSQWPGTTRDVIETRVIFGGVPVTLLDTAGLRQTSDPLEAEGVRRAEQSVRTADLVISVFDASVGAVDRTEAAGAVSSEAGMADEVRRVQVANKIDLCAAPPAGAIGVSALTGSGLDALRTALAAEALALTDAGGAPALTRTRHRVALEAARLALQRAMGCAWPELRAEELRRGLREIGRVTGTVDTEDILESIFREFCIGK